MQSNDHDSYMGFKFTSIRKNLIKGYFFEKDDYN